MKKTFSIIFLFIFVSFSYAQTKKELNPYYKRFYLGQSFNEVKAILTKYQTLFKNEETNFFRMDIPLFLYLDFFLENYKLNIDIDRERIYIDDFYFFDFKETVLNEKRFDFYFKDFFYYMVFKDIKSIPINYPSRINKHLLTFKLKFFKDILYCIEYEARLNSYEISRFQQNYLRNFDIDINKKENVFETKKGMYIIKINPEKNHIKVVIMNRSTYDAIEFFIQAQITNMLNIILKKIESKLDMAFNIKKKLFQHRKKIIKRKLKRLYKSIDEL